MFRKLISIFFILTLIVITGCNQTVESGLENYLSNNHSKISINIEKIECAPVLPGVTWSCKVTFISDLQVPQQTVVLAAVSPSFPVAFSFKHYINEHATGGCQVSVSTELDGTKYFVNDAGLLMLGILESAASAAIIQAGSNYTESVLKIHKLESYQR